MTISTTTNRISYAGDDSTTAFATGFKFYDQVDLVVILVTDSTGAEAVQVITTDYTVSGAGSDSGGTVTMNVPPASGETLVIKREQAYTQGLDLVENDPFPSESVEQQLDKLTILTQQNDSAIDRTLRQPDGDTADIGAIPAKVDRASKLLGFDANGEVQMSATVALPSSLSGQSLDFLRVNSGETAYEFRTAAQVLSDIGAQATDGDLTGLSSISGTGVVARTAADTYATREIEGTSNQIVLTNGDGVSGNPTASIDNAFVFPGTFQGSTGVAVSGILDEDNMTSNSATQGATQQSIKAYVDNLISANGGNWKASVKLASTANLTLSGEQTIDGVTTSASRILVKDQTAQEENGIYVTAAGAWSRAADADTWDELVSAAVFIEEGTLNQDTSYICTVDDGGTLETTAVVWTQFGVGGGGGLFRGNNGTVGDAPGDIFRVNSTALTADEEIEAGENASCTGPLSINTGVTLTVTGTLVIL